MKITVSLEFVGEMPTSEMDMGDLLDWTSRRIDILLGRNQPPDYKRQWAVTDVHVGR
jgi:hypothetical protein